jgi:hypothetical protein
MGYFSEYISPAWEFGGDRSCDMDNIVLPLHVSDAVCEFHAGNIDMPELIEQLDRLGVDYIYDDLTGLIDIITDESELVEPRDCPHFDMG